MDSFADSLSGCLLGCSFAYCFTDDSETSNDSEYDYLDLKQLLSIDSEYVNYPSLLFKDNFIIIANFKFDYNRK